MRTCLFGRTVAFILRLESLQFLSDPGKMRLLYATRIFLSFVVNIYGSASQISAYCPIISAWRSFFMLLCLNLQWYMYGPSHPHPHSHSQSLIAAIFTIFRMTSFGSKSNGAGAWCTEDDRDSFLIPFSNSTHWPRPHYSVPDPKRGVERIADLLGDPRLRGNAGFCSEESNQRFFD